MPKNESRVLLIDHSATSLAIISKLITKNIDGVIIDAAMNTEEAFRLLQEQKYSLITTSRNLPGIDCHDMVETIRNQLNVKRTPLIVISGEKMGVFEEDMACNLVNGYFDKKLGQQKLVDYIHSFLSADPIKAMITGNILYVEDSATIASAIKNILSKYNYNYLHASNAEQALQYIQHSFTQDNIQPFDLLLTDIQLEGHMSGRDLIREIRHGLGLGYEQLPILVTTSNNFADDPYGINRIFSSGANDILEKPTPEPMLIARLNNLLMLRKQYLQIHHPENSRTVNQ